LCIGVAAVYWPLQDHPWLWDDEVQIADNPAVTSGAPLAAYFLDPNTTTLRPDYNHGIYRPLRTLAYRALAVTAGVRPAPFEAANLVLYLMLTALVGWTIWAVTRDRFAAMTATALWAILPVHVQPVAYASALGDLLSAVLVMLMLLTGVRAARGRLVPWGALSLLLAAAAMFAKEMAITAPLLLALALWLDGRLRASLPLVGAHGVVAAGFVVLRSLVLGQVAQKPLTAATVALGLKKAPVLLMEYARLSLMPLGHRGFYLVSMSWGRLALALALILAMALLARRLRSRAFTVGVAGFALALLPVLQLMPIIADLADRFALVPSIGLALAAAALLTRLDGRRRALAALVAAALGLMLLGGNLIEQRMWRSDGALWRYSVAEEPGVGMAHANLANALLKEGRPGEALLEIDQARALGFEQPFMQVRRARALDEVGRTGEAIGVLRALLQETPGQGQLHAVLGDLLFRSGRLDEAAAQLELAERYAPNQPVTRNLRHKLGR
jgi:tetratricopeptide (TPR) repeat protein